MYTEREKEEQREAGLREWTLTVASLAAQLSECGASSVSSDSGLSSNVQWTGVASLGPKPITACSMEQQDPLRYPLTSDSAIITDRDKAEKSLHNDHASHLNGGTNDMLQKTYTQNDTKNDVLADIVSASKETDHDLSTSIIESCNYSTQLQDAKTRVHYVHTTASSHIHQTNMWMTKKSLFTADNLMYTHLDSQTVDSGLEGGMRKSKSLIGGSSKVELETEKDDEFSSLALDMDESIEELNQLILDLDPEFEPVPTMARCNKTPSGSLHSNGCTSAGSQANQSDWRHNNVPEVTSGPLFKTLNVDFLQPLQVPVINLSSQLDDPYGKDTVDYGEFNPDTNRLLWVDPKQSPSTPLFPVTPPTPYMKTSYDFSHVNLSHQSSTQHLFSRTLQESRGYMDNLKHSPVSSDEHLFPSEAALGPSSCQRGFGSMRSMNTSSPLPITDSPTLTRSWMENGSNTPISHYTPQPSPPLSLATPDAQSSPRTLPSTLSVGSLELSLLEAMEGLESLGLNGSQPSLLPQKTKSVDEPFNSASFLRNSGSPTALTPSPDSTSNKSDNVKFVQDTSKFWYKPDISREQAITVLKDKEPGAFIVRDSHSFRGAYGLAMKVATPPPTSQHQSKKGDLTSELVRHFLIECTQKGVRLKGCPNEPYFGSLTALVCQHSTTPLALPCKLIIPDKDPLEEITDAQGQTSSNSAIELLRQGAACNVWFLGSVELESLTGVQAVQKATTVILSQDPPTTSTIVHFKVSAQGITLTDNQRKLFFRRHYAVCTVIFCTTDPQDRKWSRDGCSAAKIFGFVARKSGSSTENVCHLFAEHDPEQPASAIVNFVSKVMIGSQKVK